MADYKSAAAKARYVQCVIKSSKRNVTRSRGHKIVKLILCLFTCSFINSFFFFFFLFFFFFAFVCVAGYVAIVLDCLSSPKES